MGGDDLNWAEKMKWGRSPPALGCAPKVLPAVPLLPPPGLGARSCRCSLAMPRDKNSTQAFMFPVILSKIPVAPNMVPVMPCMVPFTLSPSQ